jgi:hypothetical protein
MTLNVKQIEFLARAIINRLEDRGLVEFHDAVTGVHVVEQTLENSFRRFELEDAAQAGRE